MGRNTTTNGSGDDNRPHRHGRDTTAGHDYDHLAPRVERSWAEQFVIEQRLLNVPGASIGDSLAQVDSHLADSGETAEAAFGDATTYAREAAAPARRSHDGDKTWILGNGLSLVGMLVTGVAAIDWWFGDGRVDVSLGMIVSAALLALAFLVLHRKRGVAVVRLVLERPWVAWGAFMGIVAVLGAVLLVLPDVVLASSAALATGVGAVVLAGGTVLQWRARGRLDDPILDPQGAPPPSAVGHSLSRVTVLLFPVMTAVLILFGWVIYALP